MRKKNNVRRIRKRKIHIRDNNMNTKKNNKLWILLIGIIIFLVIIGVIGINLFRIPVPSNIKLDNSEFQEISISWDNSKRVNNYLVILSDKKFSKEDISNKLNKGKKLDDNFITNYVNGNNKIKVKVKSNTDYYVTVLSYTDSGNYSSPSKIVKIHTNKIAVDKIDEIKYEDITDNSVKLKWNGINIDTKNFDGSDINISYRILVSSQVDGEYEEVSKNIIDNEYVVTSLEPFSKYYYKVVADVLVDGLVVSGKKSDSLEIITKGSSVTGVTVKASGTDSLIVTWDKYENVPKDSDGNLGAVTYSIYGCDTKDGEYKLLAENISENSFKESKLSEGKTRYYYVISNISLASDKYESVRSDIVFGTTDKSVYSSNTISGNNASSSTSSSNSDNSKYNQAKAVAQKIANSITGSNDLEKITKAARIVSEYCSKGKYTQTGSDYYTAYGVFIKGEYSCAGATRALGMVLECMGYSWQHMNENQWTHQWVVVTMDGQVGYADGQVGIAGYGKHPIS